MRTTLTVNDAVLRELKERAAAEGRTFKELVNETLQIGLAQKDKPARTKRFRVKTHRLGMKAGVRETSMNQLYDQVEAERVFESQRP
jgi:adenylate cyclase